MTVEQARRLVAHWPVSAEYMLAERWGMMGDFWKAVDDTRIVWAWTWDLTREKAEEVLSIQNEKEERAQCNSLPTPSPQLRQARLY